MKKKKKKTKKPPIPRILKTQEEVEGGMHGSLNLRKPIKKQKYKKSPYFNNDKELFEDAEKKAQAQEKRVNREKRLKEIFPE